MVLFDIAKNLLAASTTDVNLKVKCDNEYECLMINGVKQGGIQSIN